MIVEKAIRQEYNKVTKETHVLITRKALAEYYLKVSPNQLVSYSKANLYNPPLLPIKQEDYGFKDRNAWYIHIPALLWYEKYIKKQNSPKKEKFTDLEREEDYDDYNPHTGKITTSNMRVAKELENALNERIKREKEQIELEILKKSYIPIEEADKTVAVSVRTMLSELYNMIENLPNRLKDCKNIDEIRKVIEDEFEDLIEEIRLKLLELSKDE
jgi:hypothetical protein